MPSSSSVKTRFSEPVEWLMVMFLLNEMSTLVARGLPISGEIETLEGAVERETRDEGTGARRRTGRRESDRWDEAARR